MTSQHLQCQGDQARALHSSKSAGKRLLNVLFIAYDFPPCDEIGGSLRSEKFIKYLPKFGWDYSVLSLSQASQTRPELYPNVTRIPSLTPWRRPYQVTPYGWLPTLWTKARRILSRTQHDLIYVTSPPFFHILVADWLRREFGLPLVVDFRDAWSLDPYMEGSRLKKFLYRRIFPLVEGHVLKRCDYFIANTSSAQRVYLKKYPSLNGRIAMLPNGFDEEDFAGFTPSRSADHMTLLYCGRFGICGRDPKLLLTAFKKAVQQNSRIRLRILGAHARALTDLVQKLELQSHVQLNGQVPHPEAVRAMGVCDVLVLYNEEPIQFKISMIAGKTYEYLRSGKPVIAIGPPGDNLDIIEKYASRHEIVRTHNCEEIVLAINRLYDDWVSDKLPTYAASKDEYAERFNREALTAALVSCFNRVLNRKQSS